MVFVSVGVQVGCQWQVVDVIKLTLTSAETNPQSNHQLRISSA